MKPKKQKHKKPTPSQKQKLTTAAYSSRIKALIVDMFMIYAPILYILTYVFMGSKENFLASNLAPLIAVTIYGLISAIFVAKKAQTPGKKAYDIAIVDSTSHKNISFLKAFCRFFMFLVSATTLIGALIPLYRADGRSLHDLVCKTIVIKKG